MTRTLILAVALGAILLLAAILLTDNSVGAELGRRAVESGVIR